jgi:isoquinoline 1-oxidoreductase alpha subunit
MAPLRLLVNGAPHEVDVPPDMPLLWVLRDVLGLTGTKFGCGMGLCGACTVLLDGAPARSCVITAAAAAPHGITTIEGALPGPGQAVVDAWIEEDVPQCGYCQPGQVMSALALLARTPHPSDAEIERAMEGHLCRCGTYARIRKAVHRAAGASGDPP